MPCLQLGISVAADFAGGATCRVLALVHGTCPKDEMAPRRHTARGGSDRKLLQFWAHRIPAVCFGLPRCAGPGLYSLYMQLMIICRHRRLCRKFDWIRFEAAMTSLHFERTSPCHHSS